MFRELPPWSQERRVAPLRRYNTDELGHGLRTRLERTGRVRMAHSLRDLLRGKHN